eukprot:scaffold46657_cov27-Prasinocladus_malaysianus.AAC.1
MHMSLKDGEENFETHKRFQTPCRLVGVLLPLRHASCYPSRTDAQEEALQGNNGIKTPHMNNLNEFHKSHAS